MRRGTTANKPGRQQTMKGCLKASVGLVGAEEAQGGCWGSHQPSLRTVSTMKNSQGDCEGHVVPFVWPGRCVKEAPTIGHELTSLQTGAIVQPQWNWLGARRGGATRKNSPVWGQDWAPAWLPQGLSCLNDGSVDIRASRMESPLSLEEKQTAGQVARVGVWRAWPGSSSQPAECPKPSLLASHAGNSWAFEVDYSIFLSNKHVQKGSYTWSMIY